jgi:uncharacterized protein (UPF0276 family)
MLRSAMTQLAISDSPSSRRLISENKLALQYFETQGPIVDTAFATLPNQKFLLHNALWDWSLGRPQALEHQNALNVTRRRLEQTRAPWLSVHLGFSATEIKFDKTMQALSPTLDRKILLETIVTNARALAKTIEVPLLLENLDYNPGGAYEHICEATFITEVLERTNTEMLLDIAHARVSTSRFGINIKDYLAALPMKRVKQLHISGPRLDGETLRDAHEPLEAEDYELLEYVLSQTNVKAVTLEYNKEERALLEQLWQLRTMLLT